MRRILGAAFALVMVVTLVLLSAPVSAGLGDDCTWDPEGKGIKWSNNENSWNIYLKHWGRTPIQAMSRLAGLAGPNIGTYIECPSPKNNNACWPEGCSGCRKNQDGYLAGCDDPVACDKSKAAEACPAVAASQPDPDCNPVAIYKDASCCCCWGISLAFANKAWAGCDIGNHPRINNDHPAHYGNSSGEASNRGGDWGDSGCPHTECITQSWCLQDNLCANPGVNK